MRSQARLYTIDRTPPDVTLNQAAGQADPTNTSPINFRVIFTEPVTNFATGDVTLSGTAGATTAIVTGSGTTYDVAVSGMTTDGTVVASVVAGVATDSAGNSNSASSSTDNTVTYDITPPAVTINQAAGQSDPTNASPINFTVKFTEPVAVFATGDVTLGGTAGATTAVVTGSGDTYNVAVSGMTSDGTVTASVAGSVATDAAGNANSASTSTDNSVLYDATAPTITGAQGSAGCKRKRMEQHRRRRQLHLRGRQAPRLRASTSTPWRGPPSRLEGTNQSVTSTGDCIDNAGNAGGRCHGVRHQYRQDGAQCTERPQDSSWRMEMAGTTRPRCRWALLITATQAPSKAALICAPPRAVSQARLREATSWAHAPTKPATPAHRRP